MKTQLLAYTNALFLAATIVINYLANHIPIGWMDTRQLSSLYPTLFVPAGFTFSIWILIYLLLLGFVVMQIMDLYEKRPQWFTEIIGPWFIISSLANIAWVFAWHHQYVFLSLIIMIILLISLIVIMNKITAKRFCVINQRTRVKQCVWCDFKILIYAPISIYLGWVSIATIANIAIVLHAMEWGMRGLSKVFWTIVVILFATGLGLTAIYKKSNVPFAFVIVWAFYGIYAKRVALDPIDSAAIILTLQICWTILALTWAIAAKKCIYKTFFASNQWAYG